MKSKRVDNYYQALGRRGGNTTKKRYGKRVFRLFGKMGGRPKKAFAEKASKR